MSVNLRQNRLSLLLATLASAVVTAPLAAAASQSRLDSVETVQGQELTGSFFIRIRFDPAVLPLDSDIINGLVASVAVAGRASDEVFSSRLDRPSVELRFEGSEGPSGELEDNEGVLIGFVYTDCGEPVARPILKSACRLLEAALQTTNQAAYAELRERIEVARGDVTEIQARLEGLQQQEARLQAQAGQPDLERDVVISRAQEIEDELKSLRGELRISEARQTAINVQIARISKEVEAEAERLGLRANLARIVTMRRQELEQVQALREKGAGTLDAEVETLRLVAEAQLKLDEFNQRAAAGVGGDQLQGLNQELVALNIEHEERLARLQTLEQSREAAGLEQLMSIVNNHEREVAPQISLAREALRDAIGRVERLERRLRNAQTPAVTVVGDTEPRQ